MKTVTLVEFSDLVNHAETIGYYHNQAISILDRDDIQPKYECNSYEYYDSDIDQYGWSEDTKKIMKTFFEKHNLKQFTLVND